jgi:curved DNA-binding protein CbpA
MTKHYIVLGVPQTATKEQIKRAYRRLSLIYHPDMPTADKKKYLEVKEAYDALIKIDPTKVHQQYEHRTKPYVHIISKRLSKEGNAQIFIMFENMAVAHTSHFGMSST